MIIGLDGMPLTSLKTGVGHYTFELARALARAEPTTDFDLVYPSAFPPFSLQDNEDRIPANLKCTRVPVGQISRHWWSVGLPRYIKRRGIKLFHGTNYDVPLWKRCATVLTVHDMSLVLHPEKHRGRSVRRARRRLPLMARLANALVVPTQTIKREVCDQLQVSADKVFVVPEAARDCFHPVNFEETEAQRLRLGIGSRFILAVGTIEPRKNYLALVHAFEELLAARPELNLQLVIVGGRGWLSSGVFEAIEKSPMREQIILTGYLGDDDLRALYSSCRCFIYPSMYEGFGLPPLEAMSCGAPVIAGSASAIVEVTGGAARLVDPESTEEIARAILEVVENEEMRRQLAEAGRLRAAEFSWSRTAQLTLEVYREALRRKDEG